jgi:lipoyl(octanoyl) transferase
MGRKRRLHGAWLGRRPYDMVHALQLELHAARRSGHIGDTVLFLEHDPVITLGRGGHVKHLLTSEPELAALGVSLVHTGRGGDVTLHAPGQLVCYPILDLNPDRRDVRRYVGDLALTMQRLARHYGVDAGTHSRYIGLWVDRASSSRWPGEANATQPAKLGAIGVRLSRWVTMHGFAFNLSTNLDLFRLIVPCGIAEFGVASIQTLTGGSPLAIEAAALALDALGDIFDATTDALSDREHVPHLTLQDVVAPC